jgi:hypothetical protein
MYNDWYIITMALSNFLLEKKGISLISFQFFILCPPEKFEVSLINNPEAQCHGHPLLNNSFISC